jgi:hypothetical protein
MAGFVFAHVWKESVFPFIEGGQANLIGTPAQNILYFGLLAISL